MKIAMFGHKRIPSRSGGVEVVVAELAAGMAAMGHEVTCYNRGGDDGAFAGIGLKAVPDLGGKGLSALTSSFFAAVASALSDVEVVHIHAEGPAFFCWIPKLLGKRVVVTVHGLDWQREKWHRSPGRFYIRAGEQAAVRFADEIIVLSRNLQHYFRKRYGRETAYIPNGITRSEPQAPAEIRKIGLEKDGYLLFLGRLVPEKEIHILISVFRALDTEKKLVIAGASSDTDGYVESLKVLAAGDERILFTGFAEGRLLAELYSNAFLYILPSRVEGMPMSLLEAMSYGNCCLVSDIPELTEVVEDRGVTFPCGDSRALRDALESLLNDPDTVARYKAAAADFVCGKYNWDKILEKTLELYR